MTKCDICELNDFKYKCPRCEMKTCSLNCCNKHKTDNNCSGQRDRTKYVSKDEFSDLDLLNDYRFLEENSLLVDTSQRTLAEQDQSVSKIASGFYENLRKFVNQEFNICLRIMPLQSSRHLNNKTKFTRATKMISWSMNLIFHDLNELIDIHTKNTLFSSQETLRSNLIQFYQKYKTDLFNSSTTTSKIIDKNPMFLYNYFNQSFEANLDDLNVLFRIDDYEKKQKYFIKLNLEDNLEQLLKDKTIIEYPTIYIVKKECLNQYLIQQEIKDELNIMTKSLTIDSSSKVASSGDLEDGECDTDDEEVEPDVNKSFKKIKTAEIMQ